MAVKEKQVDSTDEIEWNVENEIQLFFAMNGHKPVGKIYFVSRNHWFVGYACSFLLSKRMQKFEFKSQLIM